MLGRRRSKSPDPAPSYATRYGLAMSQHLQYDYRLSNMTLRNLSRQLRLTPVQEADVAYLMALNYAGMVYSDERPEPAELALFHEAYNRAVASERYTREAQFRRDLDHAHQMATGRFAAASRR